MHDGLDDTTPPNSIRLANHKPSTVEKFLTIQGLGVRGYKAAAGINALLGTNKHRVHWLNPGKPAPTITTLPDDFVHYSEPRILSVRECARLQSFPDWFEFQGKYTTGGERRKRECPRFSQVGNAVPPRLAKFIGMYLSEAMNQIFRATDQLAA
jgi:DNA (cytosine-5)-methyltransferase 1